MQRTDSDYSSYLTDTEDGDPSAALTGHHPLPTLHTRLQAESESDNSTDSTDEDQAGSATSITGHYSTLRGHVQAVSNSEGKHDDEETHSSDEGQVPSSKNTTLRAARPGDGLFATARYPYPQPSTPTRPWLVERKRSRLRSELPARSRSTRPTEEEDNEVDMRTLTPVQVKQLQTRQALRQLRPPPDTETFTTKHHDILSENIKLLLDATRDPSDFPDTDEDEGRSGRPTSHLSHGRGRKRSHSRSRFRSRLAKKQKVPDQPEIAGTQFPLEGLSRWPHVRARKDNDSLIKLNPQPVQMWFNTHPVIDRTDEWFVAEFRSLFRRLETYFAKYFCVHNLDEGDFHQPWAVNNTAGFLNYAQRVAEPDPSSGGWDKILRDTEQRKWLLVGIMITILESKVFKEDLWGATKEEKELMFGIEKALLTQEGTTSHPIVESYTDLRPGFARTKLRAETVRTILGPGPVTVNFHPEVAKLTARVSLLFKPLLDYMYAIPSPDGAEIPSLWDQYQDLHNVISHAAYLSLCIRLSPTIFYFTSLSPGEAFQPDDQHTLETHIFTASKAQIVADYDAVLKPWNEKRIALQKHLADLTEEDETGGSVAEQDKHGRPNTQGAIARAREAARKEARARKRNTPEAKLKRETDIKEAQAELEACSKTSPRHYGFSYRAMAKVCAWPNIRRFKPGSLEEEQANTPLQFRTGFRIYDVSKSAAVMYFGTEDRVDRARQRVCLRGLVEEKQREYGAKKWEGGGVVRAAAAYALGLAAFAALPAWALGETFTGTGAREALMGLVENFRGGFVF